MNLQINSPFKPCPYKCPFCCAGFPDDKSIFNDDEDSALYFVDKEEYLRRLAILVNTFRFDTVVITGSTEPTLFPEWMNDVITTLKICGVQNIEVTTRNETYKGDVSIQVVSYSMHAIPIYPLLSDAKITRAVFILNKGIDIDEIIGYHMHTYGQTTVKNLADNSYNNESVNAWVRENRVSLSAMEVTRLESFGIRYDHDCNNSDGRYRIFRADGNVYNSWQSREPVFSAEKAGIDFLKMFRANV